MSRGRQIKVPAENRRVTSIPSSAVVSQRKFLTLGESINNLADHVVVGTPTELSALGSDSFTLSDAIQPALGLPADLSDSLNLSDALALSEGYKVNLSDDVDSLTDSIELVRGLQIELSDSAPSMADEIQSYTLGHLLGTFADSINNADDSLGLGYGLLPAEQFSLIDSIATFGQIFLPVGESIYNWDDFLIPVPTGIGYAFEREDSFTLSDSIQLFSAGFKSFSESLTLADAYAQRANGLQTFSDSLTQSDAFLVVEGERKTLSDSSIQPTDGTARAGTIWDIGITGEQLTQSDAISVAKFPTLLTVAVSDSFTLSDEITWRRGPFRWNDSISVSTSSQSAQTLTLSDALPSMVDAQVNKFIRWRDSIAVVKINAGALNSTLSDTNSSMSDALSSSRIQYGAPVSDVSVGLWSATSLFQKIDEWTASDADLIVSATNPSNDTCEVGLTTSITDPVSSSSHVVSYRYAKSASGGRTIDLTVRLMQGTTIIATFTHSNIGNTVTQADQTLSGAEADSITNYGDLRIRFIANVSGSGAGRAAQITWAQFRCPK